MSQAAVGDPGGPVELRSHTAMQLTRETVRTSLYSNAAYKCMVRTVVCVYRYECVYSCVVFPCIGKTEQLPPLRQGVEVCVYLSITAGAQIQILRKSRGFACLKYSIS
jgi:hypothetical protein